MILLHIVLSILSLGFGTAFVKSLWDSSVEVESSIGLALLCSISTFALILTTVL